jgi:hypothetical protein
MILNLDFLEFRPKMVPGSQSEIRSHSTAKVLVFIGLTKTFDSALQVPMKNMKIHLIQNLLTFDRSFNKLRNEIKFQCLKLK